MESEIVWEKNNRIMIDYKLMLGGILIWICIAIVMYIFDVPTTDLYIILSFLIFSILISIYGVFTLPLYYGITKGGVHFKYINREKTIYWKDIQYIGDVKIGLARLVKVTGLILKNDKNMPIGSYLDRKVVEKIWYYYNYYKNRNK